MLTKRSVHPGFMCVPSLVIMRVALAVILALATLIAASTGVRASSAVVTLVAFDPNAGQLPEGVAVDKIGNVFVSWSPLGQLVKVEHGSSSAQPFGSVKGLLPGDLGLVGLAVDAPGNVYGAVISNNASANGVWEFDRKTGKEERIPGTQALTFANGIAFDKRGTMYITDTIRGAVWRVIPGGSAEVWVEGPLFRGNGSFGLPFHIGANGIAVRENTVYVSVSEQSSIVTVPIMPDGSAGTAVSFAHLPAGTFIDGIQLDVHGNIYGATLISNSLIRINADGSTSVLATAADGLDRPSSLAFGTGKGDRQSLYVVNFSIALGPPILAGPALLRIDVGTPGQPLP